MVSIIFLAMSQQAASGEAMWMVPSSSMSILSAGLGGDLLDDGAALADDLADLIGVDLHGDHLGRILG